MSILKLVGKYFLFLFSFLILFVGGCSNKDVNPKIEIPVVNEEINNEDEKIEESLEVEELDPKENIDLTLKPNEMGEIMILMYHNIGEEEGEWTRTPENFKKDLLTLYEKGYRAVRLEDFVNNNMEVEAGMTPVVITFDDGNENNFRMIEEDSGKYIVDPNSAVGIMESFKKEYPDFNITATFFIFGSNPFRQPEFITEKLDFLIENGYDIGNHTVDHRSMRKIEDKDTIQESIAKQVAIINKILTDYNVNTYALCYGERPSNKEFEEYLHKGTYGGISYENIAILNVGWNPAPSPVSNNFNPLSLPRIRASEVKVDNVGLYNWLEYFENNPNKRYISDGVKEIITVPKELEEQLDLESLKDKELFIYE